MLTTKNWLLIGSLFSTFFLALQSSAEAAVLNPAADPQTSAVISGPGDIAVNRTIVLDASASKLAGEKTDYVWTIDETKQIVGRGVEMIYTPEKTGKLTFRLTLKSKTLDGGTEESMTTHEVVVFERKVVLIADTTVPKEKLILHAENSIAQGVYLNIIQPSEETPVLGMEDAIAAMLTEKKDTFASADAVLLWTDGIYGLQALIRSIQSDPDRTAQIKNSTIILIADGSLSTLERTVFGTFSRLQPKEIIITRKEAINPLLEATNIEAFKDSLTNRDIDTVFVTDSGPGIRPWNVLTSLVNYLLSHGVSSHTVILLLMLPIIATIFAFLKQIIGITTFGLYTPSIIALSFLSLGFLPGVLFLLFILITGYLARTLMRRWRLLYIPKVAIILTVVSISLLVLVAIGTVFGITFTRDAVFMLLILSTLAENFLNLKTEEGLRAAILGVTETLFGSLLCVLVVQWQSLQSVILAYPESILLTIVINAFLGRWTGLRLVEYFRFREIFSHIQQEE